MTNDPLVKELETFEKNKERLVFESEGKWVVIRGDQLVGIWDTYEDALKAGYAASGLDTFLVKKIEGSEQLQFITRDIPLCR